MTQPIGSARAPSLPTYAGLAVAGYLLAIALLGPFLTNFVGIWGEKANVGSVLWRYGVYGQVIGGQFYMLTSIGVAGLTAALYGGRRVSLALVGVAFLVLALLVLGLPLFVLDFLQLKRSMNPEAFVPFRTAGIKVLAMSGLGIPLVAVVAFSLLRVVRATVPTRRTPAATIVSAG